MQLHQKLHDAGYAMRMYDSKTDEDVFFIDEPSRVKRDSVPIAVFSGVTVCKIEDIRAEQRKSGD